MPSKQFEMCIWSGQCFSAQRCDDYYPAMGDLEDAADEEMLQRHHHQFIEEWNEAVERHIFFA